MIMTVLGPIDPSDFGPALVHEHVLCDFIGADKTHPSRWNSDGVVQLIQPLLGKVKERGIKGFVDCTPAFIGRDPAVLARLARATGLHILTNTGYYGAAEDRFVPIHAYADSVDELANRWVVEAEQGIGPEKIRPGFMKIGVDPVGADGKLSAIDAKIVRAAARASRRTGLTIGSHTVQGKAALAQLEILAEEKVAAYKFIFIHADGEEDAGYHREVASRGAWVEFDGVSDDSIERHRKIIAAMLPRHANRLLLSHDAGWYEAGKESQTPRGYTAISDLLIPALKADGVSDATVRELLVTNPARAFSIG